MSKCVIACEQCLKCTKLCYDKVCVNCVIACEPCLYCAKVCVNYVKVCVIYVKVCLNMCHSL